MTHTTERPQRIELGYQLSGYEKEIETARQWLADPGVFVGRANALAKAFLEVHTEAERLAQLVSKWEDKCLELHNSAALNGMQTDGTGEKK